MSYPTYRSFPEVLTHPLRHGVHADAPDPADPYDEPELRLLAEDDYIADMFGEPRRGPEWIEYDPLGLSEDPDERIDR